ncbi:MAG: hypothetical protein PHW62_00965 [Candidatus Ratteibacteria bacterium]|nr:hypothetical protein [Candidatus Ratteibacteria bacterium]
MAIKRASGKNVKWAVQYLTEELKRGAGTQSVRPHKMDDEHKYKRMLALYQETKLAHPEWSIWLVGITKDWKQKNIFYHEGVSGGIDNKEIHLLIQSGYTKKQAKEEAKRRSKIQYTRRY